MKSVFQVTTHTGKPGLLLVWKNIDAGGNPRVQLEIKADSFTIWCCFVTWCLSPPLLEIMQTKTSWASSCCLLYPSHLEQCMARSRLVTECRFFQGSPCRVLVVACEIFSCGMGNLVPWSGIEPQSPALAVLTAGPLRKSLPIMHIFCLFLTRLGAGILGILKICGRYAIFSSHICKISFNGVDTLEIFTQILCMNSYYSSKIDPFWPCCPTIGLHLICGLQLLCTDCNCWPKIWGRSRVSGQCLWTWEGKNMFPVPRKSKV